MRCRLESPWIAPTRANRGLRGPASLAGTDGRIGDRGLKDAECPDGVCAPVDGGEVGVCTRGCARSCPDKANFAGTFCVEANDVSGLADGMCVAACRSNDDCVVGTTCETEPRNTQPSVVRSVCLPY